MAIAGNRRRFLRESVTAGTCLMLSNAAASAEDASGAKGPIRVMVWDEQQPTQKSAYDNFLGNAIVDHLRTQPDFAATSSRLDAPEQGLSSQLLDNCDVLIWWGHVRNREIPAETARKIIARITTGQLSLIALHSAHWSSPFVEAMNERARQDASRALAAISGAKAEVREMAPRQQYAVPKRDARVTPYLDVRKFPNDKIQADLHMPICCFPEYRNDGKPSYLRVLAPEHPIVAGIPRELELASEEMYNEPFHVPEPDVVVLEERWDGGEWFRSGMVWTLGKGRVFYLRPGHETYPTYRNPHMLRILANAARWLARSR